MYLRNRDYRSGTSRFTQHDTHWNPDNMIYGDNPGKWNGNGADGQDSSGLTIYTYRPNVHAMMQSGNGYVYGGNNPGRYQDPSGQITEAIAVVAVVSGGPTASTVLMSVGGVPHAMGTTILPTYLGYKSGQWVGNNLGVIGDALTYPLEHEPGSIYTDPVANPNNAMRSEASSDTEGGSNAIAIEAELEDVASQFGYGECKAAAIALAAVLTKRKQEYGFAKLTMEPRDFIASTMYPAKDVSSNGLHWG